MVASEEAILQVAPEIKRLNHSVLNLYLPDELSELNTEQRAAVIDGVLDALRLEGVPAAVITDSEGEVLLVRRGPPSVSEIRVLLEGPGNDR